jgi:hypothetical protein
LTTEKMEFQLSKNSLNGSNTASAFIVYLNFAQTFTEFIVCNFSTCEIISYNSLLSKVHCI